MKPPAFSYRAATSVEEALAILAEHGAEAKVLAGGQSLVPMLNFRLLKPSVILDINRVSGLDLLADTGHSIRIGALTRHRVLETSPLIARKLPVVAAAMQHVAHLAIRNRGTIGGSLSHADPAAELPLMAILLDARMKLRSAGGERTLHAKDFLLGALTTGLRDDELLCEIEIPDLPRPTYFGFEEVAQRPGDFAIAAAAVALTISDGRCIESRVAVLGGEKAVRIDAAEDIMRGNAFGSVLIRAAAQAASEASEWNDDLHASRDFRKHLVEVTTRRALEAAWASSERRAA